MSARTILNPPISLSSGDGSIDVSDIVANAVSMSGNGSTSAPSLSTNSLNNMVVSTATGSGLTLSTLVGSTTISSNANNSLVVGGTISTTEVIISGGGATDEPYFSTNSGNNMVVSTATGSGLTLSTPAGSTTISSNANNSFVVNGSITASQTVTGLTLVAQSGIICTGNIQGTTFGGGIGMTVVRGALPGTISPNGSYTFPNIEIPGFIGYSAATSYVVSPNVTTSPPIPFIYSVSYAGTTPTSTLVDVLVMNVGTLSYNVELNFSIIAMNS